MNIKAIQNFMSKHGITIVESDAHDKKALYHFIRSMEPGQGREEIIFHFPCQAFPELAFKELLRILHTSQDFGDYIRTTYGFTEEHERAYITNISGLREDLRRHQYALYQAKQIRNFFADCLYGLYSLYEPDKRL